jgi:hypothetical protein
VIVTVREVATRLDVWPSTGSPATALESQFEFHCQVLRWKAVIGAARATYLGQLGRTQSAKRLAKTSACSALEEAEHDEVAVIAAQRVRWLRCRQGGGGAKYHLTVLVTPHLFDWERHMMWPVSLKIGMVIRPCGGSLPHRFQSSVLPRCTADAGRAADPDPDLAPGSMRASRQNRRQTIDRNTVDNFGDDWHNPLVQLSKSLRSPLIFWNIVA